MIPSTITHQAVRLLLELLEDEGNDLHCGLRNHELIDLLADLRNLIDEYLAAASDEEIDGA